jgi:hypothetical protein
VRARSSDAATAEAAAGALTDALLAAEALRFRAERGVGSDPLAGLRIDDAEVERIVAELTGDGDRKGQKRVADLAAVAERARDRFREVLDASPTLLSGLVGMARLSPAEAEVLGFLVAVELAPARQRIVAYVQDDVTRTRPTLGTIRRLFGDDGVLALASASRLRRAALVDVDESVAWGSQTVTLCGPVRWAFLGDGSPDPDLPRDSTTYTLDVDPGGHGLVLAVGDDRVRRLGLAFAHTAGQGFLVSPVPSRPAEWAALVREATVSGLSIVLELEDDVTDEVRWRLEQADHLAWALCSRTELPLEHLPRRPWVERRTGDSAATAAEWEDAIGVVEHHGHRLTAEQLRLVTIAMSAHDGDLDAAVRRLASGPLDGLARRIRPRRTWDDLVLVPDKLAQLRELAARYRHRDTVHEGWGFPDFPSTGLVALFSGQSGTGKTMAAEIIAGELGLDLYKLDLSSVVSKYVGETEKNLERVFTAASAGNLVLFFDEADSLFGKRSEVSDARDRYANIETSYLLQRLESYDGLVVLATNFQKNIDEAFLRRIHVGIEFPLPEEEERLAIWRKAFPATAPVDGVDHEFLARQFKLSGGSIRNAALQSAFLAAEAGRPISMALVVHALKREFQKLGRLRTAADFGEYTELVSG